MSIADKILTALDTHFLDVFHNQKYQNPYHIVGLEGVLKSFFIHYVHRYYDKIMVIMPHGEQADNMANDLHTLNIPNVFLLNEAKDSPMQTDTIGYNKTASILNQLDECEQSIIITPSKDIFTKISSKVNQKKITIKKDEQISIKKLIEKLNTWNYQQTSYVHFSGEYATRGGILDVFSCGEEPYRLEFFGDEVVSIRSFNPDDQRSFTKHNSIDIYPNATLLDQENGTSFMSMMDSKMLYVILDMPMIEEQFKTWHEIIETTEEKNSSRFLSIQDLIQDINHQHTIHIYDQSRPHQQEKNSITLSTQPQPTINRNIKLLRNSIQNYVKQDMEIYIQCIYKQQQKRLYELLEDEPLTIILGHYSSGFIWKDAKLAFLTDHEMFNRYFRGYKKKRASKPKKNITLKGMIDLNVGDYVVHIEHGIGQFNGMKYITTHGQEREVAQINFADGDLFYIGFQNFHKIHKYTFTNDITPKLSKLGQKAWKLKTDKAKKKIRDMAQDMMRIYAKRKSQKAHAFKTDNTWQSEMEVMFEYEETPDQNLAIKMVKEDMEKEQAMDRLICADVGFGKTEIAMRSAFKAVMDHKQVILLAPTTLLVKQHYNTFKNRMQYFPIRIAMLSRFISLKEKKVILEELSEGKIDIIISTHIIMSKHIKPHNLGLIILDEEQRFGVQIKENIKKWHAAVDILTLTATPIPRTLHMTLQGCRDLSIINTPPANRVPIHTESIRYNEAFIRSAIQNELARNGQTFFIHNYVRDIEEVTHKLRLTIPEARIDFAHGQMSAPKLENIFTKIYNRQIDVLVSTNIIENGLDLPQANTIFINHANRFGMGELHQLRGRVGRSDIHAFCYLITPPLHTLTENARKRILTIEKFNDLGSGFQIALRDLDIRGYGDLLGSQQSGIINDIGIEMYQRLMTEAVQELKQSDEFQGTFKTEPLSLPYRNIKIDSDISALIPKNYIKDEHERLNLYHKLSHINNNEGIKKWKEELEDRFGALPIETINLLKIIRLRILASKISIEKITLRNQNMWLRINTKKIQIHLDTLLQSFQKLSDVKWQIIPKNQYLYLRIDNIPTIEKSIGILEKILLN